jgi:rare lipoprotein A
MIKSFVLLLPIILFFGCAGHVRFTRPGAATPAPRPIPAETRAETAGPAPRTAEAEKVVDTTAGASRPETAGGSERAYEEGEASYYAHDFHGRKTANGEKFDMNALTAAHLRLPFNTRVRVVNTENGQSVVVRINDRGPYKRDRIIDLSLAAARAISLVKNGHSRVQLYIVE